jgi:signal transduction histidine kinase
VARTYPVHATGDLPTLAEGLREVTPALVLFHPAPGEARRALAALPLESASLPPVAILLLEGEDAHLAGHLLRGGADTCLLPPHEPGMVTALIGSRLRERQRLVRLLAELPHRVATETAGAVAHELSGPLTALIGHTEMLRHRLGEGHRLTDSLGHLLELSLCCGEVLDRIRQVRSYVTRPYLAELRILDLDSSRHGAGEAEIPEAGDDGDRLAAKRGRG